MLCCAGLCGAPLAAGQTPASSAPGGLRRTRLYVMATSAVFGRVNRNDARAAAQSLFEIVARRKGFELDSRMDVVDSVAEIRARLESRSVDLVGLCVREYLELESAGLLVPALAHGIGPQGRTLYSYVLVVNPASAAASLGGLRGKSLLVFSRDGSNTGGAWMGVSLGKEKLGRAAAFFASVKATDTGQACILPVFFGSADACVVDEIDLSMAQEMNPQLNRLRVVARSRPLAEHLIATPVEPHPYRKELIDAMLTLNQDVRGRQLLMVMKCDRMTAIQPADLDSARELWRDYARLGAAPNRD